MATEQARERSDRDQQVMCVDIMTYNPVCCLPDDSVEAAARLMRSEDVGSLPVVDDQGERNLLGIITDRDIAIKVVAAGLSPQATNVEMIMTKHPICCRPTDDAHEAMRAMAEHQIRRIPIVEDGRLLGIIAQADIATRLEAPRQIAAVVEEISEPDEAGHERAVGQS